MKNYLFEAIAVIALSCTMLLTYAAFVPDFDIPLFWGSDTLKVKSFTISEVFNLKAREENKKADELLDRYEKLTDEGKTDTTSSGFLQNKLIKGKAPLDHFFAALINEAPNKLIRIGHYGDSHVEGDRFSSDIREAFQKKFGGGGGGFMPMIDITTHVSATTSSTPNWERHTVFTRQVKGGLYGISGMVFRFSHYGVIESTVSKKNDSSDSEEDNTFDDKNSDDKSKTVKKKNKNTIEDSLSNSNNNNQLDTTNGSLNKKTQKDTTKQQGTVKKKSKKTTTTDSNTKKDKGKTNPAGESTTPKQENQNEKPNNVPTSLIHRTGLFDSIAEADALRNPIKSLEFAEHYNLNKDNRLQVPMQASVFIPFEAIVSNLFGISNDQKVKPDSVIRRTSWYKTADINLNMHRFPNYEKISLYYGDVPETFRIQGFDVLTGSKILDEKIAPSHGFKIKELAFSSNTRNFKLEFSAEQSPDIFGLSFDTYKGVQVDNYGIRGHDGGGLQLINTDFLATQIQQLNTKLMLFQFGPNATPFYKTRESCIKLEEVYYQTLMKIKKADPEISILVLSIGDMMAPSRGENISLPNVPLIRDAQKRAADRADCAFFDILEAMGGANSIFNWVAKGFAVPDGHLSPAGEKILVKAIMSNLMSEFEKYKLRSDSHNRIIDDNKHY